MTLEKTEMIRYKSTRGTTPPVGFDEAILSGFAADGGLFVPDTIPLFNPAELEEMAQLEYLALAERIIRRFIDPVIMPDHDLRKLLRNSFLYFDAEETVPVDLP